MENTKTYYAVMLKKGSVFLRIGTDLAALEKFGERGSGENLVTITDTEKNARKILTQQSSGHKVAIGTDVTL